MTQLHKNSCSPIKKPHCSLRILYLVAANELVALCSFAELRRLSKHAFMSITLRQLHRFYETV